jgi:hypothetical protein
MVGNILSERRQENVAKIDGDNMEEKKLTEEQQGKIKKLRKSHFIKSSFSGLKLGLLIVLTNVVITAIDFLYVHSEAFAFVASFFSALLIFRSFGLDSQKEYDKFKEECKKILES